MNNKMRNTVNRRPSRNRKKSQASPVLPIAIGGFACLLVVAFVTISSSEEPKKQPTHQVAKVEAPKVTKKIAKKKQTIQVVKEKISNQIATSTKAPEFKEVGLQDLKVEIRELALGRKWNEAFALIDGYTGPLASELSLMRREVENKKSQYETFLTTKKKVAPKVVTSKVTSNYVSKATSKPTKSPEPVSNGFPEETAKDRAKKKKAKDVSLVVHSRTVGLAGNLIVVWKDRSKVLSYSRLIKNLANEKSKYFPERVEKAKKYLSDNSGYYALVPFEAAKMTLRSRGFTVSEVFFNQKTEADRYHASVSGRYKGYIISYDIRPGGFGMGC
jgi:hypothetical protein